MVPQKLVHAPIWVLFRNIPPELWSLVGFSTIASGIETPVHSELSKLNPYSNGVIKLKVVVELDKPQSSYVRWGTPCWSQLNSPGHLGLRCPSTTAPPVLIGHKVVQSSAIPANSPIGEASLQIPNTVDPLAGSSHPFQVIPVTTIDSEGSSSGGWLHVVHKSKPPQIQSRSSSPNIQPVTSSQFDELIKTAQQIIRKRIVNAKSTPSHHV